MSSTKFSIKCGLIILINGLFSSFLLVLNFKRIIVGKWSDKEWVITAGETTLFIIELFT